MSGLQGAPALKAGASTDCPRRLGPGAINVVASAIRRAWEEIQADPASNLPPFTGRPTEDHFTYAIHQMLEQMLEHPERSVPGFNAQFFSQVNRGSAFANYSHVRLTKQPDLVIRLADRDKYDIGTYIGIFVEAKIVDRGVSNYTDDGVARFVEGEYAWAMRDGVMLAYQAGGVTGLATLRSRLKTHKPLRTRPVQEGKDEVLHESPLPTVCARSLHDRVWKYRDQSPPGVIQLWHLWQLEIPASVWSTSSTAPAPASNVRRKKTR